MTSDEVPVHVRPMLRCENGSLVIPGDRLGRTAVSQLFATTRREPRQKGIQLIAGPGTYERGGQLFASVVGRVHVSSPLTTPDTEVIGTKSATDNKFNGNETPSEVGRLRVSVIPKGGCSRAQQQVIRQGQTVLARVVRIAAQQVTVDIVANQYGLLDYSCNGCIRREDVKSGISTPLHSSESNTTTAQQQPLLATAHLTQSFRPGDWIVARVLSLGDDTRRYFLSTAEPSLGVIHALSSISNRAMIPISWKEMECPVTGNKESRKCARPPKIPAGTNL
jgi:exosome complex component CSL4